MTEERWPLTLGECAARLRVRPRTLRQRLKDIREAMPDVVPYTPAGRGKVFFEDDSELLRVCLKALHSRPRYVAASPRSKVLLPGEGFVT